jgi:uncharacterized protein YecT (DUF1311 family)
MQNRQLARVVARVVVLAALAVPAAGCGSQPSTLAIVACYETKTENVDTQIDSVQQGYYTSAPLVSVTASIVSQDSAWLAARGPVCSAAFHTGGSAANSSAGVRSLRMRRGGC